MKKSDIEKLEKIDTNNIIGKTITLAGATHTDNTPMYFKIKNYYHLYNAPGIAIESEAGNWYFAPYSKLKEIKESNLEIMSNEPKIIYK